MAREKERSSEGESLFFQVISGPAQRFNGEATAYQGYKNLNLFQCIIKLIEFYSIKIVKKTGW
ncbi:MAG: hypothetical protein R2875_01075 [Desulfobacterales bacterium]